MGHGSVLRRVERALRSIGYRNELLLPDYEYADVAGEAYSVRKVPLAAFAQKPPSYRNACIGVIISNSLSGEDYVRQHHSLGAPMIFEIGPTTLNRWKITRGGDAVAIGRISHDEIENAFSAHKDDWNPDRVLRAKGIMADPGPRQLDFIDLGLMPALAGVIHKKLDRLLGDTLSKVVRAYKQFNGSEPKIDYQFRLVFRLIAAKVFRDRRLRGGWDADDPVTILKAVEEHYNTESQNVLPFLRYRREIAEIAWEEISSAFHFQNLSVDDLAFIYENTFVTPQIRKKLGTHSTPPLIAEYLVRKLPFEELSENDRCVLEPFSGGGIFLLTAMRRLRELLPSDWSDKRRHDYFVNQLTGIEIDTFAREVCQLSLMLADYPNPDGWRLYDDDIYETDRLERELEQARIILCNPPFEKFDDKERNKYGDNIKCVYKPAELLRRVLSKPPRLIGFVLPSAFSTGNSYRNFHRQLAELYSRIELVELPEVFNFSEVPTVLLLASDFCKGNTFVSLFNRSYTKGTLERLFTEGEEAVPVTQLLNVPDGKDSPFSLLIPRLSRIWKYLEAFPVLEQVADIHRGIYWKGRKKRVKRGERRTDVISDQPLSGFMKGVARAEGNFRQYSVCNLQYLSIRPEDQENYAYQYSWGSHKVVCNAARLSRTAWRIGAFADAIGLAFSKQFFAFWPSNEVSIYALSALLNSPVANAWCFSKDLQIDNRIQTLSQLPIPHTSFLFSGGEIDVLSREMHDRIQTRQANLLASDDATLGQLLLQIDAAILKAYDLPPVLERELLDQFQNVPRPVPFEFNGYYPQDLTAFLPLHELISDDFQGARADHLLERLEPVYDTKISEMITWLTET